MQDSDLCVFIVDDNHDAALTLKDLLSVLGYRSHVFFDPEEALVAAKLHKPAVVLLDLGMPKIDGFELASQIKALHPETMLVACTGWGSAEARMKAITAGFVHHMVKPLNPDELQLLLEHTPYTARANQRC